ncbi:hypothetical protein, partial [Gilvimarinus sp. 1_MG-2023]|nr:hypothetical protein [Gilvimarinus sp. 1_MG-2023]
EVVADAGVLLSVLLVGHPRLRNDLRRPQMEEIGYRTTIFDYEGIGADQRRDYVAWLLGACADERATRGRPFSPSVSRNLR